MSPVNEKFSVPLSHVFAFVQQEVNRLGHTCIEPEHLLLGLIEEKQSVAYQLFVQLQVNLEDLKTELHQILSQVQTDKTCEALTMSEETKHMLELGMNTEELVSRPYFGTEHLLVGIVSDVSSRGHAILQRRGVTYNQLLDQLKTQPNEPLVGDRVMSKLSLEVPYIPAENLTFVGILTRISPVFWGLLLASVVSGMAAYFHWLRADVSVFLFVTLGWIVAVCLHEFGHALAAYRGGDQAVLQRGYLTLNPLRYTHGFMSIVLPVLVLLLGGIGLPGGAVFVNLAAVKSKKLRSLVAAAGPLVTLLLTLILSLLLAYYHRTANFSQHSEFIAGLNFLIFIQIWALVFNLLPIPGFDGFGIIMPFLPRTIAARLYQASSLILFVFISLYLLDPSAQSFFWRMVYGVMSLFNVDSNLLFYGLDLYRFW